MKCDSGDTCKSCLADEPQMPLLHDSGDPCKPSRHRSVKEGWLRIEQHALDDLKYVEEVQHAAPTMWAHRCAYIETRAYSFLFFSRGDTFV